jgi:hypothetical protein
MTHLEFEISCVESKHWFFEVNYHSNSPLALWNRYLRALAYFIVVQILRHTPSCSWSECRL